MKELLIILVLIVLLTMGLYALILIFISKFKNTYNFEKYGFQCKVSIIIAAKNEEKNIVKRIKNITLSDYPIEKIQIIVASDGSTDNTVNLVKKFIEENESINIKALDFLESNGRAEVHNKSIKHASGEILLFTDAETIFDSKFIQEIITPYQEESIGGVVGRLSYKDTKTDIGKVANKYWDFETKYREAESKLGILAFGTGACVSFRKKLFLDLDKHEDIDYAQTLNIILQGKRMYFSKKALAYDFIDSTKKRTFNNRVRQTSKSFLSILSRATNQEILKRPFTLISILFHKVFRHLMPFLLILIFIINFYVTINNNHISYQLLFIAQTTFYLLGIITLLFNISNKILNYIGIFLIINSARFIGVIKAITGQTPKTYTRQND